MNRTEASTQYPIVVRETRTITLSEASLWDRIEHDIGDILSSIYKELNTPTTDFDDAYEDGWHEAVGLVTKVFKGCIDYNLNDSETETFWVV